jgi:putative transcriptional regulator
VPGYYAVQNRRRLGQRVAQVRRERGWTQEALAERLDVSVRYLQAIEAGEENMTLDSLTQLALRLDLSLAELVKDVFVGRRSLATRTSDDDGSPATSSRAAEDPSPGGRGAKVRPTRPKKRPAQ